MISGSIAFKRALLVLVGLVIGSGLVAVGLLLWNPAGLTGRSITDEEIERLQVQLDSGPIAIFEYDPDLSYRFKPDFTGIRFGQGRFAHVTNSRGMLGPDEYNPDPSIQKVLFLGDSITYGQCVPAEQVFPSLVAENLGPDVQVMTAACPGWSTHQELGYLEKYLGDLEWDLVILIFCLNDLVRFEWVYANRRTFKLSEEMEGVGGLLNLNQTKNAFRLRNIRWRLAEKPGGARLGEHNNTVMWAWDPERWSRLEKDVLSRIPTFSNVGSWLVMPVPTVQQVEILSRGADPEMTGFPQARLREFCEDNGITMIDPLPEWGEAGSRIHLSGYIDDLHFSQQGNRLAAEFLVPAIRQKLME